MVARSIVIVALASCGDSKPAEPPPTQAEAPRPAPADVPPEPQPIDANVTTGPKCESLRTQFLERNRAATLAMVKGGPLEAEARKAVDREEPAIRTHFVAVCETIDDRKKLTDCILGLDSPAVDASCTEILQTLRRGISLRTKLGGE